MGWGCGRMGLVGFGQENEEPLALWHGRGWECGTGKGATRGKGVGPTR